MKTFPPRIKSILLVCALIVSVFFSLFIQNQSAEASTEEPSAKAQTFDSPGN